MDGLTSWLRLGLLLLLPRSDACSNWLMPHDTGLSGRTTDLGGKGLEFKLRTLPRGSTGHSRGFASRDWPVHEYLRV